MDRKIRITQVFLLIFLTGTFSYSFPAEKRAMTVEDVMNFHHLFSPVINHNGKWIAYSARPDFGDGYGILVSADGNTEHKIPRGRSPRFSSTGKWVIFNQPPPFKETYEVKPADQPEDSLILINVSEQGYETFGLLKQASFSESREYLFVHQHYPQDSTLTKEQNEKLKKAGSPLLVRNLGSGQQRIIPFVENFTVDSLATTLIYAVKDTLRPGSRLYQLKLDKLLSDPSAVDTTEGVKFNGFTWHEETSKLAYLRALAMEKDTIETAVLHLWKLSEEKPLQILTNGDAPQGFFIPFNSHLSWNQEGNRLFYGLRPEAFAAKADKKQLKNLDIESVRANAELDVWHFNDPLIKTHEKARWKQVKNQNMMAVYHLDENRMVQLANEEIPDVQLPASGNFALAYASLPHAKRITWEGRFRDVYTVNLLNGEKKMILENFGELIYISPDGSHVLYFEYPDWWSYDTRTGEYKNLTASLDVPFYNEDHDRPSTPSGYRIGGWLEDKKSALIYDNFDIWRVDLSNGEIINITNGYGRENQVALRINKLDKEPFFSLKGELFLEGFSEINKQRAIYKARPDRKGIKKVLDTQQNLSLKQLSTDGNTIIFTNEAFDVFPDLWLTKTNFRNTRQITNLNEQLQAFNWGRAELISYQSADGIPLQGIVIKPGNYDPSVRYPVFVYYYEKFSHRLHDFNQTVVNHRPGFGFYSSNEYVLLLPDIHFIEGRPGMSAVKSLIPAVQKLIDEGIADPAAIGLHGHSWSGYQTAYVVTQTDLFAAAIAGAPVSNMTSAYGGIRWGSGMARQFQYETGQSRLGASLFENRDLYIENSPLFYANEINTPLLLMHGDKDDAVPWEQSIELYLAMRRVGKEVIFLQYRDEPHHPQKYANKLDYTIRMKEYFDHYLKGEQAPIWMKEGRPYWEE